jgi:2-polyprenyl-3-methyl-5-hydroxy-6-metoxy-1,4-benzoquinol methylase
VNIAEAYRFSLPESRLREQQRRLTGYFRGRHAVLDIGCGRGVFLDLLRDQGIGGAGVDVMPDAVAHCRAKGHPAEVGEAVAFLEDKLERYDGILCSHLIEHLDFEPATLLLTRCFRALIANGRLVIVTPNPRDLSIIGEVFWLDPTHRRPYPAALIESMLASAGFAAVESSAPLGRPARRREWPGWLVRKVALGSYFGNPESIVVASKPEGAPPAG